MKDSIERKDIKSIAKAISKTKNSNFGSPSKALVFQPKNLNKHLQDKPNFGLDASETKEDSNVEIPKDGDPVLSPKEKSLKKEMKDIIKTTKKNALSSITEMNGDIKKKADRKEKKEILKGDRKSYREDHKGLLKRMFGKYRPGLTDKINK